VWRRRRAGEDDEGRPRERTRGMGAREVSVDRIGDGVCGVMHSGRRRHDVVWIEGGVFGGVGLVVGARRDAGDAGWVSVGRFRDDDDDDDD